MFAVVETGGKQYQVQEGRYIDIDLLKENPDDTLTFDKVVAIVAGEKSQIGQPYIDGASVTAKVLKHDKGDKITVYKMKRKKGYRLKKGHRQEYTRVLVENIEFPQKDETLSYVKEIDDEKTRVQKEKEDKIEAIRTKREEEKQAKKAKKEQEKAETEKKEKTQKAKSKKEADVSDAPTDSSEVVTEQATLNAEEVPPETEAETKPAEEATIAEAPTESSAEVLTEQAGAEEQSQEESGEAEENKE